MSRYGIVSWTFNSRYGCKNLIVTPASLRDPSQANLVHTWSKVRANYKAKNGTVKGYYGCTGCRAMGSSISNCASVTIDVEEGTFLTDPFKTVHACEPKSNHSVRGIEVRREELANMKSNGGRTAEALVKISSRAMTKYSGEDELVRDNIRATACGKKEASTAQAIRRARAQLYPTIPSLDQITTTLSYTFGGLHANPSDARFQEVMLRYKSPELAIFLSPYGAALLKRSKHVVCDGTFAYAPAGTLQIYRVFGLIGGESTPFATALMTRKREQDYDLLWTQIRMVLDENNADLRIKYAHFDCEVASVKAFKKTFPEVRAKMCMFHVKQNVTRHMQNLGLMPIYGRSALMETIVRQMGALCLVPENTVEAVFLQLRSDLPCDDSQENWPPGTCATLNRLFDYYWNEWIQNSLGLDFINLYDMEDGPRTTNHAEGYHGAQKNNYRTTNMPLGEWLYTFQKVHHREEAHIRDVLLGISDGKPRLQSTQYIDGELKTAKEGLEIALDLHDGDVGAAKQAIISYLTRVGALIGYNRTEIDQ
uniref:MULE domain-containing protein n=1 Tax=Steinernema glaseri TaxID=37863 RepID=A0A1I7Y184_9BILA